MYNTLVLDPLILLFFLCLILFVIITVMYFGVIKPFMSSRKYILMEISRSTGSECVHWEKELKRLYVSYIPIIGPVLSNRRRKHKRNKK